MTHNDALQRTPHPERGGGPTPPLVSRGSEEEGGTRKPTEGFPSSDREGEPTSPPRDGEEASASIKERGGLFRNQEGDKEPPPNQSGREGPFLPKGGYRITGKAEERTEKRKRKANRTDQKNQHDVPTRAGNFAC